MIWKNVAGNTGFVEFEYALVGTYRLPSGKLILIDSGTEEAPELLDDLQRMGVSVCAVINTHLHVDHVANNRALQERYGAEIYVPELETTPAKLNYIQNCTVQVVAKDAACLTVEGITFPILSLPGHSPGQLAVVTPDGVCFLGDAMMVGDYLHTSKLPYMEDVDGAMISMEKLRETQFPYYVFAHKGVCVRGELDRVIDENIEKEIELYTLLKQQVSEEMTEETLREKYKDALKISSATRDKPWLNETINNRIGSLVRVGEVGRKNDLLYPIQ